MALQAAELRDVCKRFGNRVEALRGLSLPIFEGERLAVLGKSGSGKSTLLSLLGGLERPTSGTILVGQQDLAGMSRRQLADYRLRRVGMVFQGYHLVPTWTALENVEMPLTLARAPRAERRRKALEALERVGLTNRAGHRPSQLSGGEQQRAALARALINKPPLLLADEPTGNLDSATATEIIELLRECTADETTLVLVTHDEELAAELADRVVHVSDGKLDDKEASSVAEMGPA